MNGFPATSAHDLGDVDTSGIEHEAAFRLLNLIGSFEDWKTRSEGPPRRGELLDIYQKCLGAARNVPKTRLLPTLDIIATNEATDCSERSSPSSVRVYEVASRAVIAPLDSDIKIIGPGGVDAAV